MVICHYPIPSEPTIRHSITQYTAKRKKHQLPLAIPYRHSQKLLERAVASCLLRPYSQRSWSAAALTAENTEGPPTPCPYSQRSPARRRFVLAERVRGSYTGSAQSEERFGRNPCKKTRFSGALLSSENWLMQGEMAVPCCVLKRRLARGAALPCCVLKRSTGAIVRPRTCAKNRVAPGN